MFAIKLILFFLFIGGCYFVYMVYQAKKNGWKPTPGSPAENYPDVVVKPPRPIIEPKPFVPPVADKVPDIPANIPDFDPTTVTDEDAEETLKASEPDITPAAGPVEAPAEKPKTRDDSIPQEHITFTDYFGKPLSTKPYYHNTIRRNRSMCGIIMDIVIPELDKDRTLSLAAILGPVSPNGLFGQLLYKGEVIAHQGWGIGGGLRYEAKAGIDDGKSLQFRLNISDPKKRYNNWACELQAAFYDTRLV